jgi:hypothetical protein
MRSNSKGKAMDMTLEKQMHNLAKNIDYALRINEAKFILVASDCNGEGKSSFLSECTPVLTKIYKKKVLIYDCQTERDDLLEKKMTLSSTAHQFIRHTETKGLDYLHGDDLSFMKGLPEDKKASTLMAHFNEVTKEYDVVFINMKTLKRAEKTTLPILPIDGAILIRSSKKVEEKEKFITNELIDREIPIIGLVKNEGI